jgi:hypothetical protein
MRFVDFSLKGFKDKVSLQLFEWRLEIVRLVMKKPKKALGKRTREIADVSLSSPQHFLYKKAVSKSGLPTPEFRVRYTAPLRLNATFSGAAP